MAERNFEVPATVTITNVDFHEKLLSYVQPNEVTLYIEYYQTKEKEFFLRIYKLLLDSKNKLGVGEGICENDELLVKVFDNV